MGSPRSVTNGARMLPVLALVLIFVVGYVGFQQIQSRKDVDSKDLELLDVRKNLEKYVKKADELLEKVRTIQSEQAAMTKKVAEMEREKRLRDEEGTKMVASLGDKDSQIRNLRDRVSELAEAEKQASELQSHVKELEGQLEVLKSKVPSNTSDIETDKMPKEQGEDKDHGLAAEDKVETHSNPEDDGGSAKGGDGDGDTNVEDGDGARGNAEEGDGATRGGAAEDGEALQVNSDEVTKSQEFDDRKRDD